MFVKSKRYLVKDFRFAQTCVARVLRKRKEQSGVQWSNNLASRYRNVFPGIKFDNYKSTILVLIDW